MTIDKSFIEKIQSLCPANVVEISGLSYADKNISLVLPPQIDTITVHTLSAVEEFCQKEIGGGTNHYIIHVKSPGLVRILSAPDSYRQRETPLVVELLATPFPFGKFLSVEHFIIALQSQFVQDETTAAMLRLVGNLTTTAESRSLDDGVSQVVEARVGLSKRHNVVVPNPVKLAPYRTFVEIDQPASNFVFRIDAKDHSCAIFEADGGAWKNEATASIKARLETTLADEIMVGNFTILS